eukprot:gene12127-16235_t
MGSSNSKSETIPIQKPRERDERHYRLPKVREKDRFEPAENTTYTSAFEASVDKFDYLIVFPLTRNVHSLLASDGGGYFGNSSDSFYPISYIGLGITEIIQFILCIKKVDKYESVGWSNKSPPYGVKEIWYHASPGKEADKIAAVQTLQEIWNKRLKSKANESGPNKSKFKENVKILRVEWLSIARETIIEQLATKYGLQLKMSANSEHIFCRIRAPIKLLEVRCDADDYLLQFRGEIDPGSEDFWNTEKNGIAVEIEEESVQYSKDSAQQILNKLYRAGKIGPGDLLIDEVEENRSTWSRRIHALERIADKVPITNKYIPYSQFSVKKPHLRYLYQTYPSVRGHTLFRSKDRLLLTKSIIDSAFDTSVLKQAGIIDSITALHDANRGEKLSIESLSNRWIYFWSAKSSEVGCPYVSHEAYDEYEQLWWYLRPWSQPLHDIRDYFGEKIAMYFAWLAFYTYALVFPAVFGCICFAFVYVRGYNNTYRNFDWLKYGFSFAVITWAVIYIQLWSQECKLVALKWGTRGFENVEKDRPEFRGDVGTNNENRSSGAATNAAESHRRKGVQRSVIDNRLHIFYPEEKRLVTQIGSSIVIAFLVCVDLFVYFCIYYAQNFLMVESIIPQEPLYYYVFSGVVAITIQILSIIFMNIAYGLNYFENYRSDNDYEDSLILKMLFFELFNSYGSLFFTSFFKGEIFKSCYEANCSNDAEYLLYAIIILRLLIMISFLLTSLFKSLGNLCGLDYLWQVCCGNGRTGNNSNGDNSDEYTKLSTSFNDDETDDLHFMSEADLSDYAGTFLQFKDEVIQFGYICLYSSSMPLLAPVSLCENLLRIRLEAFNLCFFTKRPDIELAEDAGYWTENTIIFIVLGIYNTVALYCFSYRDIIEYSFSTRLIIFCFISQFLILYMLILMRIWPDESDYAKEIDARQNFIVDKFFKGVEDNDEDLDANTAKGNLNDQYLYNHIDSLNLFDLRKGIPVSDEQYSIMEAKETERRELIRDLIAAKEKLKVIYKSETFNEITGVGESLYGLPLGRLKVKLIQLTGLILPEEPKQPTRIKIRISIKPTKSGQSAPCPPLGALGDSRELPVSIDGMVPHINESLGPFAPIRTIDAEVVFNILDMDPSKNEANIGTTSVPLRDLRDQTQHSRSIHVSLRKMDGTLQLQSSSQNEKNPSSNTLLYVNLTFQYSKVVPLRNKVFSIQDKLQTLDRELARLKAGRL